jgi:hypothetical protein
MSLLRTQKIYKLKDAASRLQVHISPLSIFTPLAKPNYSSFHLRTFSIPSNNITMSVPQTTKAVKKIAQGQAVVQELPIPTLPQGHLLVKTKAVSINPTDWKGVHSDNVKTIDRKIGSDFAGEVAVVGPGVTNFKVGDKIAGLSPGA